MFRLRPQYKIPPGQIYGSGGHLQRPCSRKALIIAIQNYSVHGRLSCPHKDAKKFENLLRFTYGYREEEMVIMLDSPEIPAHLQPTHANVMRELRGFSMHQQPGDTFVFYYAGHSDQIPNCDGTERDDLDECIITIDNKRIRDNDLNQYLVQTMLPGSKLFAFLDTCHSGTLLDLPHDLCNKGGNWLNRRASHWPFNLSLATAGVALGAFRQLFDPPEGTPGVYHDLAGAFYRHPLASRARATARFCSGSCARSCPPSARPFALSLSACGDSEYAWECPTGESTMTAILVKFLESRPNPTFDELIGEVRRKAKISERVRKSAGLRLNEARYLVPSTPQLSGLYPLDMESRLQL